MKLRGAGSTIEVPSPDEDSDLRDPMGIITIPKDVTERIEADLDRKNKEIYYSIVGRDGLEDNSQHNELRVQGSFESKQNVLKETAKIFADIEKWIYECIGAIRMNGYSGTTINEGQNFFIYTVKQLNEQFKEAIASKAPFYQKVIGEKIIQTEYKNDPEGLERERIKQILNPFYFFSDEQFEAIREQVGERNYIFYKFFDNLIARFEAENAPLNRIAPEREMPERLNLINDFLQQIFNDNEQLFRSTEESGTDTE